MTSKMLIFFVVCLSLIMIILGITLITSASLLGKHSQCSAKRDNMTKKNLHMNRYHRYYYNPFLPIPRLKTIYVPERIGYLIPKIHFDDFEKVLPLYKKQLDRSGYRFMYYTYVNDTIIYLKDSHGKMCNDDTYGCYEFYNKDITVIFDREYVLHIY